MSESEREHERERVEAADADSEADKQEYQVLHTPVGDAQPGETVELNPEVAEAFEDNLVPAGEEPPDEEEGVRSQVVGQSSGAETLADQDEPIEAGEYEVYRTPIGEHQPGDVVYFEESVARAFADNLLPTDADAEAEAEVAPESESEDEDVRSAAESGVEAAQERRDSAAAEAEAEAEDSSDGDESDADAESESESEKSFDSPEEFLDQSISEIKNDLKAADFTDEQLEALLEAEQEGADRSGAKSAIESYR